jgi:hypothetical protein
MQVLRTAQSRQYDYIDVRSPSGIEIHYRRYKATGHIERYHGQLPVYKTQVWKCAPVHMFRALTELFNTEMAM